MRTRLITAAVRHETDVHPDFTAVTGTPMPDVVGALLTFVLVTAVAMLIASAAAWALAASTGRYQGVAKARTGVLIALGCATLSGGALAWTNWLIDVGTRL
jgi:steroid 5-alpha reductase family enzyme